MRAAPPTTRTGSRRWIDPLSSMFASTVCSISTVLCINPPQRRLVIGADRIICSNDKQRECTSPLCIAILQKGQRHEDQVVPALVSSSRTFVVTPRYETAPVTGTPSSPFLSFSSVSSTSVVNASPIALAALRSAVRATFVGSMIPALSMSTYSPVAAL